MSVFYEDLRRPARLSMLFFECLALLTLEDPQQTVQSLIERAWRRAGKTKRPTAEQVAYIASRLESAQEEHDEGAGEEQSGPVPVKPKTLGSDYNLWLNELTGEELCMFVAGWDFERARQLYCVCDRDDVKALAKAKLTFDRQKIQVDYEAVMYGFGGHYEGDGPDNAGGSGSSRGRVVEFDLTKGGGDGLAKLSEMLKL